MAGWKLKDWLEQGQKDKPPMTEEEIRAGIKFLREHNPPYPKPEDCPGEECREYRPACKVTCKIAMVMCGDW